MSVVYGWVKNIVCFYILLTAVLHVLPNNTYQKYVRFFGGLMFVVMLLTPILEFIYNEDYLLDQISYHSFWQEMDTMELDVEKMDATQKRAYQSEYEKAIGNDVALMAEEGELSVQEVSVKLNEDYTVQSIAMNVCFSEPGGIYVEKITLADNSREYPKVAELKKKLAGFYQVGEEQIQIVVQEG